MSGAAFVEQGKKAGQAGKRATAVSPNRPTLPTTNLEPNRWPVQSLPAEYVPENPDNTRQAIQAMLPPQSLQTKPDRPGQDLFFRPETATITRTGGVQPVVQAKFWELTASGKYEWHEEEAGDRFEPVMAGSAQAKHGRGEDWFSWPVFRLKADVLTAVDDIPEEDDLDEEDQEILEAAKTPAESQGKSATATKKKKKKKKKPSTAALTGSGPTASADAPSETAKASAPEDPLTSWQAIYRSQPEVKGWKSGALDQQIAYLQKQIDAQWQRFSPKMIELQAAAAKLENAAFKEEIEAVVGQLEVGWPSYNGKFNDFATFIQRATNQADKATGYAERAGRGWNYFLQPQAEDVWWRFLPTTNNANIKQIATHANQTQHTADHRPETILYFQTALANNHYTVVGDKISILNGSGHIYDLANKNKLTLDGDSAPLERVYGYVWKNGTEYTRGRAIPGSTKKTLSTFPLFNHLGAETGSFTLPDPLMVIVNTLSNDLSKDPGTAYIKT